MMELLERENRPLPAVVRIVDIDMPFGSMVTFMVKWAIATIPALIILVMAATLIVGAFSALGFLL